MKNKFFTNIMRELDKGTKYFRNHTMKYLVGCTVDSLDLIDLERLKIFLWKSLVYRLVNRCVIAGIKL